MLRYEVRLGKDNFKRDEMVWKEKYLSPNLSYITGVTNPNYHIEKFSKLASTNNIININSSLDLECENVQRQGYIIVRDKEYKVYTGETFDYSIIKTGETIPYSYIIHNGKYFYWGKFANEDISGYTIDNLLNLDENTNEIVETIKVPCEKNDKVIKIDTLYWIEDGIVNIDGHQYYYDRNEGDYGILKYGENGVALDASAITKCWDIDFHPYSATSMYEEVTKFKLTKGDDQQESFSRITFARYYYYVKYKEHYCEVKQKFNDDGSFEFVCEIPYFVLSGKTEEMLSNLNVKEYPLYYILEHGDEGAAAHYDTSYSNGDKVDSAHIDEHSVYNMNDLKNIETFICIDEEEKAYFKVENNVMNSNGGTEIIVYLDNPYASLNIGDKIKFRDSLNINYEDSVYNSNVYSGKDENFVVYDSKKYPIEKNLMDKVVINGNEYDVDYSLSGKVENVNCFVTINDEKVPMLIKSVDGGAYSSGELQRYGKIVSGTTNAQRVSDAVYDIKPYDGITIDGLKHIIYEIKSNDGDKAYQYVVMGMPKEYTFVITNKVGDSMYVCNPYVNSTEFTDEFNRMYSHEACSEVVANQNRFTLYVQNKVFGEKQITSDLPFIRTASPTSSDDYYDLFNDLTIYVNNGYIHIPLLFNVDVGGNMLQEEIVNRDFYEEEKRKAINPIVDMEKDVYMPKFIRGYYNYDDTIHYYDNNEPKMYRGSSTMFESISKINLNFHFRTRNMDSWKINDGYNMLDTSATTDNWFVTDFHPYCDILNTRQTVSGDTLMQASDLMGLLYFTDDDIFYQKNKVGKSFARISFYDSTDPQTQSLLSTSCIFVDEHALFKKFIDNSRKYVNDYGSVSTPIFREENGYVVEPKEDITSDKKLGFIHKYNKTNVRSEYLGPVGDRVKYEKYDRDGINARVGDEAHRISSRLVVDNKYVTDTSSEGFYAYIFREYSENLHPKPIYMKIEFNHAGIGKVIPFLIPMHWKRKDDTDTNKMVPDRTLQLKSRDDLAELKKGYPLSYVYAQTYIPLYAVYDFRKKEYGYIFDDRYVEVDENGDINLNLFELKVMNEDNKPSDEELDDITKNIQEKAIINVNTRQFDTKAFNYEVEH